MSEANLRQLKELYGVTKEKGIRGSWYIGKKHQGFDFAFPPKNSTTGKIVIRHEDLESRIKVYLNGEFVGKMSGGSFEEIEVSNVNTGKQNEVRIENDGRSDWGYIYSVDLV